MGKEMRYTKKSTKFVNAYEWNKDLPTKTFVQLGMNKLGEYEDIEEELGIELTTLFKILKANECYSKEDGECRIVGIDMNGVILMPKKFPFGECEFTVPFAEFGKTWALTREGLQQ